MMTITDQTTVGEVARTFPPSVRIFQQYGIDFCCGGKKQLAEVCREKGVPLERLLEGVENARQPLGNSQAPDWDSVPLSQLIDYILDKHHSYLNAELPRLGTMMAKVIEVHGINHGETLQPLAKVYIGLRRELEEHMWKEENILFPLIKQMEEDKRGRVPVPKMFVGGPIQMMELEHESAGNALRQMRQLSSNYQTPEDGCNTYRALLDGLKAMEEDLHQHIHLENNILFPRAIQLED